MTNGNLEWGVRLQTFYGVLLSVTFGLVLTHREQLGGLGAEADVKWVSFALSSLLVIVAADNWYNYHLNLPQIPNGDSQGIKVGLVVAGLLCYSFYPFLFAVTFGPTAWSRPFLFAINLGIVAVIDYLGKWKVPQGEADWNVRWLVASRGILILFLVFFLAKIKLRPGSDAPVTEAWLLWGWVAYRLGDHFIRTSVAKKRKVEASPTPQVGS